MLWYSHGADRHIQAYIFKPIKELGDTQKHNIGKWSGDRQTDKLDKMKLGNVKQAAIKY